MPNKCFRDTVTKQFFLSAKIISYCFSLQFVTTRKCLVLSTKRLVVAAKFLVAATKILPVVPNFVVA